MKAPAPRVLIVTEHASAQFGGEAALPLHYFRVLRNRGVPVRLVTHSRTRPELDALYPGDADIHYIEDTGFHKLMARWGGMMPARIGYFTVGFASRFSVQMAQRKLVRRLIREHGVDVIHQPMPVSPREPSMLYGFGVPVVIGPMNGGLDYPPGLRHQQGSAERLLLTLGRANAKFLNRLMRGKREAATLLVANERTRRSLPEGVCSHVVELVENGVDLTVWRSPADAPHEPESLSRADAVPSFVFMGRLVDWKAADLLLRAFAAACRQAPMRLCVIGDGPDRHSLEALALELGVAADETQADATVRFVGWQSQAACAELLSRADALVLPSLLEVGGAVVLEAMALGKAVIATAWGGPLDYLDPSCGILVPPDSREQLIEGLTAAMLALTRNPAERAAMGRSGRAKVKRVYDWERKVDRMLAVYANAIERHVERRSA